MIRSNGISIPITETPKSNPPPGPPPSEFTEKRYLLRSGSSQTLNLRVL